MPPLDSVLAVMFAGTLLSLMPGPSMLYVLSRSVGQSRAAGLASALGLAMGGVFLAMATALGLARLFSEIPVLVVVLRYVGSAYLVWLGVNMILDARTDPLIDLKVAKVTPKSFSTIISQGILVEFLNPKTVLFFALFLPPFVDVGAGAGPHASVQSQLLVLGVLVPLTAVPADAFIAYMGGTLTQRINHQQKFRERLGWAGGLILTTIAVNLHLSYF
jgi:threonine/homoserine/homoserine lactone efflux protein